MGGFLRQLLDVISWQFDYFHPNRRKFKYLMFAVQLLPVLYYFQLIEVKPKVEVLKRHFLCVKYWSICVRESRHFSAIKLLIFYNKEPTLQLISHNFSVNVANFVPNFVVKFKSSY